MKIKRIFSLIFLVVVCSVSLCACETDKEVSSTMDEIIIPTTTDNVSEVMAENTNGLNLSDSDITVIEYNSNIATELQAPEDVGASVFTILTKNNNKETIARNISDNKTLVEVMKEYSNVLNAETFNITYDKDTQQLEYLVCGFATTYSFNSKIDMFVVQSPLFDKNVSYLIDDMKYDEKEKTMYIFLTEGWPYYEEAHTDDDEKILKEGIEEANGATILFFNELNNNIKPEHYVLVMPE